MFGAGLEQPTRRERNLVGQPPHGFSGEWSSRYRWLMRHPALRTRFTARTASRGAVSVLLLVAIASATACEKPAVRWLDDVPQATDDPSPYTHPPFVTIDSTMRDSSATADALLVQDMLRETTALSLLAPRVLEMAESRQRAETQPVPPAPMQMTAPAPSQSMGDGDAPIDSVRCARSLRVALAPSRGRVAVWWSRRDRGRVLLLAAWRDTLVAESRLGAWRGPIVVDSLDQGPMDAQASLRGAAGCARVAPSVVVDDAHGYVHVAYALTGPEGPGVFYAHQMDPRASFEVPQAIVYGEALGAVRVAATDDVVAVVYEDPNGGERPRIGLAVSRTSGHLFEDRVIASSAIATAKDPYVAIRGKAIVVGWSEFPTGGGEALWRVRRAVVR